MIGQLLLHYRVVEKIGEGGQGTVYKVIDTTLDRPAVIKVLPPDLTDRPSNLARFEREAKLASSLDHPNICTIFGLHKVGDIHFMTMQYVEGRNVRELVGGQPLDLRRALAIEIQVTDALAAAHSRGIAHRDIKARNVMVTRSGTVKVLDFGLAKLIESPHASSSDPQLTEVGVPYGTSTYAAPEQAQGLKADYRADIFSCGVLLYEMLSGMWPFRGKTALDVRYAVVYHQPAPIAEARGEDSPALRRIKEILDKALAKSPEDRYQRIEDMRSDLQEVLRELEVDSSLGATLTDAPAVKAPALVKSFWTKPRKIAAIATAAVVLILALFVIAFRRERPAEPDSTINSLAVLPFTNSDPASEYLSDGITESLIDSLSRVPNLKVKSSSTVFHYKGRDEDPRKIGRELGVHALLSGSVVQNGDELSVNVELIDVRDDSHIWGERYARKVSEVVALPQQISRDVSQRLRSRADNMDHAQLTRNFSPDSEAYRLYLQVRFNWNKRTVEGKLEEAIAEFKQGLKILPDNVFAVTALGHTQALAGRRAEAEKAIARLQELSKQQYVSPFQTAVIYAGLDDRPRAIDWLEKSRQERFNWLPFIKVDPVFKNLRTEARFVELCKNLGL